MAIEFVFFIDINLNITEDKSLAYNAKSNSQLDRNQQIVNIES